MARNYPATTRQGNPIRRQGRAAQRSLFISHSGRIMFCPARPNTLYFRSPNTPSHISAMGNDNNTYHESLELGQCLKRSQRERRVNCLPASPTPSSSTGPRSGIGAGTLVSAFVATVWSADNNILPLAMSKIILLRHFPNCVNRDIAAVHGCGQVGVVLRDWVSSATSSSSLAQQNESVPEDEK